MVLSARGIGFGGRGWVLGGGACLSQESSFTKELSGGKPTLPFTGCMAHGQKRGGGDTYIVLLGTCLRKDFQHLPTSFHKLLWSSERHAEGGGEVGHEHPWRWPSLLRIYSGRAWAPPPPKIWCPCCLQFSGNLNNQDTLLFAESQWKICAGRFNTTGIGFPKDSEHGSM